MKIEIVEYRYYDAPGYVLLVVGIICLLLAAVGAVLLYRLLNGKR